MENGMYSLNSLRSMEIIDINTGCKLGYIKDLVVDCDNYKIISILVPNQNSGWFSKNSDIEIPWSKITKIGVDVILIDGRDILYNND
ncbi:YlmC/YmxH family sporulation protein [Clostridium pasteurianum]|uniref:Sporulation protein, YlmC/YmxH family n=1 Tax=Clostridium pasteurianum BC1 TaxID=86416 RepID=R4K9S9_CLOPA|nr:YlmC/YmxH family sporulation protein [Clostridium pasteurianum]AGK97289.1 sporulation protein, YlmC/YmxH family [Clostridium pasteurianum BC1]